MLRKLLIIGSIAALFVLSAAPAFGLTLQTGPDNTTRVPLDIGDGTTEDPSNPAHGPHCGAIGTCSVGVSQEVPGHHAPGLITSRESTGGGTGGILPVNVGAWNAVFGPGGMSNDKTPICGIRVEPIVEDGGLFGTNTCL
jgi:hypothetical protein